MAPTIHQRPRPRPTRSQLSIGPMAPTMWQHLRLRSWRNQLLIALLVPTMRQNLRLGSRRPAEPAADRSEVSSTPAVHHSGVTGGLGGACDFGSIKFAGLQDSSADICSCTHDIVTDEVCGRLPRPPEKLTNAGNYGSHVRFAPLFPAMRQHPLDTAMTPADRGNRWFRRCASGLDQSQSETSCRVLRRFRRYASAQGSDQSRASGRELRRSAYAQGHYQGGVTCRLYSCLW